MKRCLSWMVILIFLLCTASAQADFSWICPNCGYEANGNFCANCGAPMGSAVPDHAPEKLVRLDLDIGFEKNRLSSRYDVKLFIDDEFVAVLDHGTAYKGSLEVTPGSHTIAFCKAGNSTVDGSKIFVAEGPALFSCVIHARWNRIEITGERTVGISDDDPFPGDGSIYVNGDLLLEVNIEFRRNLSLSRYDVEMYVDDIYITMLPHGNDFQGILRVSEGNHVIMFYKAGDQRVRGQSRFSVSGDASFSCKITAKSKTVDVSREKIR